MDVLNSVQPVVESRWFLVAVCVLADAIVGDPVYRLHPIRIIGSTLGAYERWLFRLGLNTRAGGVLLFALLLLTFGGAFGGVYLVLRELHWLPAWLWLVYLGTHMIALKDLCGHGRRIARASADGDMETARQYCGWLVGRDTQRLDARMCNRAAVESISEGLTDGVLSPLIYLMLFGMPGLLVFKIVSTMDSMVGYKNERYLRFGWFGARFDDALNYVPARATWLLLSLAAALLPTCAGGRALRQGWRQHALVPGPNSGWSEATAAGALRLRLIGPIWLNGELVTDIWLGDPADEEGASADDVERMIRLANLTTALLLLLAGAAAIGIS